MRIRRNNHFYPRHPSEERVPTFGGAGRTLQAEYSNQYHGCVYSAAPFGFAQ